MDEQVTEQEARAAVQRSLDWQDDSAAEKSLEPISLATTMSSATRRERR